MDSPSLNSHALEGHGPHKGAADQPPVDSENMRAVKQAFRAYIDSGMTSGVEALLSISHENCRFCPPNAGGRVLHGRDEVRAFFSEAEEAGRSVSVRPRTFAEDGDEIVVSGSMRVARPGGGFAESQIRWIYRFRDGRVEEAGWAPRHPA